MAIGQSGSGTTEGDGRPEMIEFTKKVDMTYHMGSSDGPGSIITPIRLRGENYDEWARAVRTALRAKRKYGFVEGTIDKPTTEERLGDWEAVHNMLVSWITNTLEPTVRSTIGEYEDARLLWNSLKARFCVVSGTRVCQLRMALSECKQLNDESVADYFGRLSKVWDELITYVKVPTCRCGRCCCDVVGQVERLREEEYVHHFLIGLGGTYGPLKSNLLALEPLPSIERAYQQIIQAERLHAGETNAYRGGRENVAAFKTSFIDESVSVYKTQQDIRGKHRSEDMADKFCKHCNREGHDDSSCFQRVSLGVNFMSSMSILQPEFEQFMDKVEPNASCIISDMWMWFTTKVARKFGIPRIVFHGPGCFYLLASYYTFIYNVSESVSSDSEPFSVPGLPEQIKFNKRELESTSHDLKDWDAFVGNLLDSEKEAYGIIVNTFEELEPEYVEAYKKLKPNKVWCIGPVSLCNKDNLEKSQRGNVKTAVDENECLKWLDSLNPGSAIYACLGSLNNLKPAHMMELGLGLEASNKPFIWVIRENEDSKELKKLILENGLEERTKSRGLLIWGWAPQVLILSHPSIGAFLTHCGWNSTLEGVAAGLPLITWPLFVDQFYNEKLAVQVVGTGVRVGVEAPMKWGEEENIGVSVKKEMVEKAIYMVLDGGEEGERRREKARELSEMAKRATENGGSSHQNITLFLEDIMQQIT